ncbi:MULTISPECIES: hypothetical protein [Haloarcula]|uniref:hypothetical protein n=1 Tax=Haloarcula TaxID=2237 RepID=UPI0023E8BE8C|nr:hypothetical protein [Halomicroarcula sp. SHR3]
MQPDDSCGECGGELTQVRAVRQLFEPDPTTMTDGQLADQLAAGMGGFYEEGVHGTTVRVFRCEDCGHRLERH